MTTPAMSQRAPGISFDVDSVEPARYAAAPTLRFALRVTGPDGVDVRSVALNTQIRLAAPRRRHDPVIEAALVDLFGDSSRWGKTIGSLLWTQVTSHVPRFEGETLFDLLVPCTYDFEVTASKYLHVLGTDGEVPLDLMFSGTVFYMEAGSLRTSQIPHDREATTAMPVTTWREMMDHYFPNTAWLRTDRDVFDRLYTYRAARGLPTWDATLRSLLEESSTEEGAGSWTG